MDFGVFGEFAVLLVCAAVAGALLTLLKQPVLVAYIIVGVLVGPSALGLVTLHSEVELLAQVGVAILLFIVGLKLDLDHVRHIGPVALATGLGQITFTVVIGFGLTMALGRPVVEALYIAVALTFSSTIIIVKLLSDKRELDSLHGRIAVGFLIVQDLAVIVAMMFVSALRGEGDAAQSTADAIVAIAARVAVAAVGLVVLIRFVMPRVVGVMARSPELLLVFAVAWGTGLAALGEQFGFSKEAGAFMAGFSLASTPFRDAITARLTGLRDFLLLFFFIDLGARMNVASLGNELVPGLVLSVFVLVGNPLIVMGIMGFMGYRKRTGFLAGLTVAQISEFSIVFIAMGISLGHVGDRALGLVTLVGLVTIAGSTYMILFSSSLYERLAPWLGRFERAIPFREVEVDATVVGHATAPEVVVVGLGGCGEGLVRSLAGAGCRVLGVDSDPEVVRRLVGEAFEVRFGDANDADFVEGLPLARALWVVSCLPDHDTAAGLVGALRSAGYGGEIAALVRHRDSVAALEARGVVVIDPVIETTARAVSLVSAPRAKLSSP